MPSHFGEGIFLVKVCVVSNRMFTPIANVG